MESSIFDAIGIDPGIILIFVLGVLLIVLVYMIKISMKMSRFIKKYKMFMRGMDGASLERAFAARFNQMDLLEENSRNHMEEIRKIKEVQNITLNKVAIVKYDAFHEMGGELSFALTMLDENNNGWIFNAMHSREGCYTYIKEVVNGESYIELSSEEKECLEKAVYQEKYDLRDMEE